MSASSLNAPPTMASRVRVNDDVLFQELQGEAVLLNLNSGMYFGLDPVGTRIWRLLEQDAGLKSVHETLLAEFEVDAPRLEQDLKELISRLAEAGLVTVGTPDAQQA